MPWAITSLLLLPAFTYVNGYFRIDHYFRWPGYDADALTLQFTPFIGVCLLALLSAARGYKLGGRESWFARILLCVSVAENGIVALYLIQWTVDGWALERGLSIRLAAGK